MCIRDRRGLYRMLVPHPPSRQILRYEQVADGSGFGAPTPYFVGEGENVTAFRQLAVDGDIYALLQADVARYFNGRRLTYTLDPTPDAEDLRPGVNLGRMAMTGGRGVGQLLVWDSVHSRVIAYAKNDASYIEQFVGSGVELSDLRGMYVIDRGEAEPPILIWASATTIYETVLEPTAEPEPTASPEPGATPRLTPAPGTPDPTDRPRRTPRETPAT